uniref:Nitrilase n=1 Tax=uncultured organism TaxID=155900 RepID=Q6RWQ0_9ZZZZ|nr:nitrilase [uncultured organism]
MQDRVPIVRAAAIQAEPIVLDCDATVEKACRLIGEAAENGANLIVFPEAFIPVYPNAAIWGRGLATFGGQRQKYVWTRLWNNSVEIPGPATDRLAKAAHEARATVVMGLNERAVDNNTLYNTLLFIGPDGRLLGKHRKLMPTNHERMIWGMGDGSTLRVFDTPCGKVGGLICWENYMPLARYALYGQGEQIHVAPTAHDGEITLVNARNTAYEGRLFVISVCMILRKSSFPHDFELGEELAEADDFIKSGGSAIVGPDGEVLAGPLWNEENILYADLDLNRIVDERRVFDVTGHYSRPDVLRLHFNASPQKTIERYEQPLDPSEG